MEILTFKCNEINKSISFHGLWYFLSTQEPCSILSYDDILLLFLWNILSFTLSCFIHLFSWNLTLCTTWSNFIFLLINGQLFGAAYWTLHHFLTHLLCNPSAFYHIHMWLLVSVTSAPLFHLFLDYYHDFININFTTYLYQQSSSICA